MFLICNCYWSVCIHFADIDECENEINPPCPSSAICINTKGSYKCLHTDPYKQAEDGRTCMGNGCEHTAH